jgi:DNA-binding GntR family transcriptional regulator
MKEPARFDPYVLDTLLPDLVGHDRQPSAFLVYLYLADRVTRGRARGCAVSLTQFAVDTGLSKTAVQRALRTLVRRRLVRVERATATAVPVYTPLRPWARREKAV